MSAKRRTKPLQPRTTTEYLTALETAIRELAYHQHLFTVFRHFVELSALTLSNAADPIHKAAREAHYLTIVRQDKPAEFRKFPPLFGMLVMSLEHEHTDVLGSLSHRLELHNEQAGQFFTPYPVCLAAAKMLVHDAKHLVEEREFIRTQEPCVGSGAMVIALAQVLRGEGINYQQSLHVTALDLDIIAVHMAYVQCTVLHIPALIVHGETLRGETYSVWRTFAHVMGCWDIKLAREPRPLPVLHEAAPHAQTAPTTEAHAALPPEAPPGAPEPRRARGTQESNRQLTLFSFTRGQSLRDGYRCAHALRTLYAATIHPLAIDKEVTMEEPPEKWCLECGHKLKALYFMGEIHDGSICEQFGLYDSIYLRKLAKAY